MCSPLLSFFKSGRLSESWHDWLINVLVRRPAVHFHVWSHFLLTFVGLRANGHASTGCPVPPSLCRVASESIGQPMTDLFVEGIMWISEFELALLWAVYPTSWGSSGTPRRKLWSALLNKILFFFLCWHNMVHISIKPVLLDAFTRINSVLPFL